MPLFLKKRFGFLPGYAKTELPFVLLVAIAAFAAASVPPPDSVSLPIRVYPPDGTSEHVEPITLTVEAPSGVDSLYVHAHQPFNSIGGWNKGVADDGFDPEGAAEIRLNGKAGGTWTPIRDENVDCAWPEEAYQCIAGVYHTVRFTLPVSNVQSGSNTIEFKFNGTEGVRSGYRVLGIGFMTPSDPSVQDFDPFRHGAHDPSQLEKDNVSEWLPPEGFGNATAIQEGARIWNETGILNEVDGTDIRASCGSCHAKDGRDLKYFGYSNRTIIARSRAHGLSAEQGKKIAAYIRSRVLRTENGASYDAPGRPWNPPYQPGPAGFGPDGKQGPDEANPVYWAAGAGIDWVLDTPREVPGTRRDMLAYLFPASGDHSNPQGVAWYNDPVSGKRELPWREVSTDSTLNMRSMPLALQFPDWNNWLPKIHPMDAVPDQFIDGEAQRWYQEEVPEALQSGDLGGIETATRRMKSELRNTDGVTNHPKPAGYSDNKHAISRASVQQWLAVKYWETFHGHHLEDKADDAYCDDPDRPWCEPLGWIGRQRIPFDIAGHISAPSGQQSAPWIYSGEAQEKVFSHIWYHLQMVLNPGTQPRSSGQTPVDIGYQRGHVSNTVEFYDIPHGFRQFQTEIKVWQVNSRTGRIDDSRRGWNANISRTNFFEDSITRRENVTRALQTAGMRAWWDQMRRHDISDFPREATNEYYYPERYPPEPDEYPVNPRQGLQTYQYIIHANERDRLPESLIDSIGTEWGQPMWPTTGEETSGPAWDEIATPPIQQDLTLDEGWNIISVHVAPENASVEQVFAETDRVSFMKNEVGQAYIPALDVNQIGEWSILEGYKVYAEDTQEATVTGTPVDSDTPIELSEGWNLIPFYPRTPIDAATALAPIDDVLTVARDENGNEYKPSRNINEIGNLTPGNGYAVYVRSDTTFTYPVDSE